MIAISTPCLFLTKLCSTIQYDTVQYSTIQYNTVRYSTILYGVQYCKARTAYFPEDPEERQHFEAGNECHGPAHVAPQHLHIDADPLGSLPPESGPSYPSPATVTMGEGAQQYCVTVTTLSL